MIDPAAILQNQSRTEQYIARLEAQVQAQAEEIQALKTTQEQPTLAEKGASE